MENRSHIKHEYIPLQDQPINEVELNKLLIEESTFAICLAYHFIGDDDHKARYILNNKINELNEIRGEMYFGSGAYECFYQERFRLEYKLYNESRAIYYIENWRPLNNGYKLQVFEYDDKEYQRHKIYSILLLKIH